MTEKYFPQVGDNELMLTEMPHMNLYDETDLISNITGDYVDKNYLEWQPIAENTKPKHPYHQPLEEPLQRIQQLLQVSGKNRLFQNENLARQRLPSKRKSQVNY